MSTHSSRNIFLLGYQLHSFGCPMLILVDQNTPSLGPCLNLVQVSNHVIIFLLQAIQDYSMISSGDRVLVCLSGGKDSLSLLHALHQYQFYSRSKGVTFDLGAAIVDPQTSSYDPSPLKGYLSQLGVPYFYEEQRK